MQDIPFDDVPALKAKISSEFGAWGPEMRITQEMINSFAELTGDHQWIHVDVERARRESPFKGTIAHGFLVLSLLPTLRASADYRITGHGNATNYGADKLRFVSPVPAGASLHARGRLVAVDARPPGTLVTQEIAVHVVGSERPAVLYTMLVLYQPPAQYGSAPGGR